jgi:Sec-independent protein translocase protein TatA
MFNVGPEKLILLLVLGLIVLGPQRLPDMARRLGNTLAALRRLSIEVQADVSRGLGEPGGTLLQAMGDLRDGLSGLRNEASTPVKPAVSTVDGPSPTLPRPDAPDVPESN